MFYMEGNEFYVFVRFEECTQWASYKNQLYKQIHF